MGDEWDRGQGTDKLEHVQGLQTPFYEANQIPLLQTWKEEPNPVSWSQTSLHCAAAQQDEHAVLVGQTWAFARCCKAQAKLSENGKPEQMLTSEKLVCTDNKRKAQRDSPKRLFSFAFFWCLD